MFSGRLGFCLLAAAAAFFVASGCETHVDPEEELLVQLKHKNAAERARAAQFIREMRPVPEKFIKPLIEALSDSDPEVRKAAADALNEVGIAGRPYQTEIGKLSNEHFDPQVRLALERAFNRLNEPQ